MAKSNIVFRSYRLNLDNEQQRRVNKVLAELNTDIHKSVNQFITDAIDFYGPMSILWTQKVESLC